MSGLYVREKTKNMEGCKNFIKTNFFVKQFVFTVEKRPRGNEGKGEKTPFTYENSLTKRRIHS